MNKVSQEITIHLAIGKDRGDAYDSLYRPSYLNDLNAMHEAEKVLRNQWNEYFEQLISIRWRDAQPDRHPADLSPSGATAAQRAEAFLRTIGKFTEA